MSANDLTIPLGLCQCGCGNPTSLVTHTCRKRGRVRGQPAAYLPGHNSLRAKSLKQRFLSHVDVIPDGCWEWTGYRLYTGYGRFAVGSRTAGTKRVVYAHRMSYELFVGPVPDGHDLDHLCRNRACVNPAHLEPVTHRENCLRGKAPNIQRHHSGKCKRGHDQIPENRRAERDKRGVIRHRCRLCANERGRNLRARRKAEAMHARKALDKTINPLGVPA